MAAQNVHVDIDVSDPSGSYAGRFVLRPFLTLAQQLASAEQYTRLTRNFDKFLPPDVNTIKEVLEAAVPNLPDEILSGATVALWDRFGRTHPITQLVKVLCDLNQHIVESPDWWKNPEKGKLDGYHIQNWGVVVSLDQELARAQEALSTPVETKSE